MSPETRSAVMARIRGRNTGPEKTVAAALRMMRTKFVTHAADLPGRPDIVFRSRKVAIFIDGDFWHGWRFPAWRHKLSQKWEEKIAKNIGRDRTNHRKLRRMGWKVVRLWEHQIEQDLTSCLVRIRGALEESEIEEIPGNRRRGAA